VNDSTAFTEQDIKRFWSKVGPINPDTQCMLWEATLSGNGYGGFMINKKFLPAHRVAWMLSYGNIPEGFLVCHRCDTPICCNPEHLFLGTPADNMTDRNNKGRNAKGVKHGSSSLVDEQVLEIRRLYSSGTHTQQQLAIMYEVSQVQISHIVLRKQWKHLE
jgi:hypothetical protein